MKHYLLTWYGMTDLRAELGVEDTDGPVLSALKTGDYSDVVILAYTNPEKDQRAFAGALRERWEAWAGAPTQIGHRSPEPTFSRSWMLLATPKPGMTSSQAGSRTSWPPWVSS